MTTIEFTKEELPKVKELFPEKFKSKYPYKEGDEVFYALLDGETDRLKWANDKESISFHNAGFLFQSKEALEEDNKLHSAIQGVKDYIRMNDIEVGEFELDELNFYFENDVREKEVYVEWSNQCKTFNPLGKDHWIKNEADADKVLEACGDDLKLIYR